MFEDLEKYYEPGKTYDETVQDKMDELEERFEDYKDWITDIFSDFVDSILEEEINDHTIELFKECKEEILENREKLNEYEETIQKYKDKYGEII